MAGGMDDGYSGGLNGTGKKAATKKEFLKRLDKAIAQLHKEAKEHHVNLFSLCQEEDGYRMRFTDSKEFIIRAAENLLKTMLEQVMEIDKDGVDHVMKATVSSIQEAMKQ